MTRAPRRGAFRASLRGPVDSTTYDRDAGWRWVSWGPWGRAERFLKLAAYAFACVAATYLFLETPSHPSRAASGAMRLAGWLLLGFLTPLQILDIRDRWLMRDYLSNAINVPRVFAHPLVGALLLWGGRSEDVSRVAIVFGSSLLIALVFEAIFLWKHLGREHRLPGGVPHSVFWAFLALYVGVYALVVHAGLEAT